MKNLYMFENMSVKELSSVNGGRNKAAYKFGKFVGKTARDVAISIGVGLLF
ncbi:bacteriocin [Latilactobacillus sakei]